MKKRGKQFFALWLALMLSAVSVPQAVQLQAAGSVKDAADPEYRITHQPTAEEPCLKLNKEGASFAWYKAAPAVCEVVPDKKQDNQIEAETTEYSGSKGRSCDSNSLQWFFRDGPGWIRKFSVW